MVSLSLPTVEWAPFAFVAWIPLLLWLPHGTPGQRFRFGWLTGIMFQFIIFRWIPFTVTEMTSLPLPVAWAMCLLYALWHGLQIGIFALIAAPAARLVAKRAPGLSIVTVALVYAALEWLWPVVFPWSIAHAAWQLGPVHNIAAIIGVPGVTFFIILGQGGLAAWIEARLLGRSAPRAAVFVATALSAILLVAGTLWWQHASNAEPTRVLRVAIVQPNYTLEEKKHATFAKRKELLDRFEVQLRSLPAGRFDLVVASEGSFPLFWRTDAPPIGVEALGELLPTRRIQRAIAEGPHTRAMIGGLRQVHEADPAERAIANSVVFFEPDGSIAGSYDKRLLVPFSEYMPFSDLFPSLKNAVRGIGNIRRGDHDCAFALDGANAACGICYETLFANETREQVGDATILTNFTIDTWFGKTTAPRLHLASHSSRAIELGIPLVRAALTGISAVVSPSGEVLGRLEMDVTGILAVDVPLVDISTPFRATGPIFAGFAALMTLMLALLSFIAHRRSRKTREHAGSDGVKAGVKAKATTKDAARRAKTSGSAEGESAQAATGNTESSHDTTKGRGA